ncbi:MAG: transporter substrate-binding domain-containing protein [Desulfobacterales bacterium]|nr:transporter substrate-binding domain-containing protein [Desulfobacterales bacterium]
MLRLATDPWPPYSLGQKGCALKSGYAFDIGLEMSKRLHCVLKADLLPWNRVLACMKNGTYDITFPIQSKPEREVFMVFSNTIFEDMVFLWHLKNRKDTLSGWKTIDDLKPYTIGIVSGYTYRNKMDRAIESGIIKTEKINSPECNFKKLLGGRFDGFLESESVVMSFFQKHPEYGKQITHAPQIVSKDIFRIGISKNSPFAQRLSEINRIIYEMKQDGTIERILITAN